MDTFVHSLLTVGITAGWIVAVVLLLRLLLKKAPRWITVCLWALVALRLLCPVTFESPVSVVPSTRVEQMVETVLPPSPPPAAEIEPSSPSATQPTRSPVDVPSSVPPVTETPAAPTRSPTSLLLVAWGVGFAAMLLYAVISTALLFVRMRDAVKLRGRIYQSDRTSMPFVLGVFRPRIYLPFGLDTEERLFVEAHEEMHIRRGDHLWKPLGFLLLSVYWFQPLLWVAYWCLCRDIEAACDERVVKTLSPDERKHYSYTLVAIGQERRRIAVCPVAFGETGLKERVKRVMNYKKPAVWIIAVAVLLTAVASVCLLTNRTDSSPLQGSFEGATLVIESDPWQKVSVREMDVEEAAYKMLEDGTDTPLMFRVETVDLEDMTITVSFSKPLWVDGVKAESVTLPYDTEDVKVRSENGDYIYTLRLFAPHSQTYESVGDLMLASNWQDGKASETAYRDGELTLRLFPTYFRLSFGRLSDHDMIGTYRETEDRLILTEDAAVAEYVFIKEDGGNLRYDAASSYRHKVAKTLLPDDGTTLRHLYRVEMARRSDGYNATVLDWDGRVVLTDDGFSGRPQYELMSDEVLRIAGWNDGQELYTERHLYVDLSTMTAMETFDQVISSRESKASASLIEEGGMHFVRVVQYSFEDCGTQPTQTVNTKFRLYSIGDIVTANVRVWLEHYRLTIAYTNKVGEPIVTVYNWHTGDRVESRLHTVNGSAAAEERPSVQTVFTQEDRRLHYSGITHAFYHLGDGQYVDLLTALKDGTVTLERLVSEVKADIDSGTLKDMAYYRDGTRHGTYDENDTLQSVTLSTLSNGDRDIYLGDPHAATEHNSPEPLAFVAVCY